MKRLGLLRGIVLELAAVVVLAVLGAVCLPMIWAQTAMGDNSPVAAMDDTDSIDDPS